MHITHSITRRRWRRTGVLVLLLAAVGGCRSHSDAGGGELDTSGNVLHASFSGDVNQQVTYRGDEVGIGYLPTGKSAMFSIGGKKEVEGRELDVTLGPLMDVALRPGPVEPEDGFLHGGMVTAGPAEEPDQYSSADFISFYDTSADTSGSSSSLTFSKVEKEPSSNPMLVRYHLVGRFALHAAHSPNRLPEACARDAVMAALNGAVRHPPYNAQLCHAKRADVDATFDVRVELFATDS